MPPLHVVDHPGRKPATVWLHHGIGAAESWATLLPEAAGGRRAIAYDRHDLGRSPRGRGFTGRLFDEGCADLIALLRERCDAPVHLVGHSDGATVALLCAARAPELVESVVSISAHVEGEMGTIGTLRRLGPPPGWDPQMVRHLERIHGEDWREVTTAWWRLWTSQEWEGWSIVDELGDIRCPLLVMHDRTDELSPVTHARRLLDAVPGAEASWWATGRHDPHLSDRARFVAELEAFWAEVEERAWQASQDSAQRTPKPGEAPPARG